MTDNLGRVDVNATEVLQESSENLQYYLEKASDLIHLEGNFVLVDGQRVAAVGESVDEVEAARESEAGIVVHITPLAHARGWPMPYVGRATG